MPLSPGNIWTAGHSTRSVEDFLTIIRSFNIQQIVDVRRYPGSKKYPQYNKDEFRAWLNAAGIEYVHLENLGGRRKPHPDSKNTAWRHTAFRGYADYMETAEFMIAYQQLENIASKMRTAIVCSEAVWWSCHRALISDMLKFRGWTVLHIISAGKAKEHPYTAPASIENEKLNYG